MEILPGSDSKARDGRTRLKKYLLAAVEKPAYFGDSLAEFERHLRAALKEGIVVREAYLCCT